MDCIVIEANGATAAMIFCRGGSDRDTLTSGTGADTFDFNSTGDNPPSGRDTIAGFNQGQGAGLTRKQSSGTGVGNLAIRILSQGSKFSASALVQEALKSVSSSPRSSAR